MFKKSNEEKESNKHTDNLQEENQLENENLQDEENSDAKDSNEEKTEETLMPHQEKIEKQEERIKELELLLKNEQEECLSYCDALKRQQAEFVNYKKRIDRERDKDRKFAIKEFALDLLEVVDNLERALETQDTEDRSEIYKGVELVLKQFKGVMKKNFIEEEYPLHEPYNSDFHEVILKEESDEYEPDTVIEVFQKGYKLHGKILRPAMVKVAK